jgi:transcriptional regulator with XRE-family HTH domain
MENSSVTASFNSSFAVILRGLLARSPGTGQKTTYKTLAKYLEVKQQSVSSWANGTTIPDTKHIAPIADYFGVSCDYLLGREREPNHATTDICRETALAPEAVEVLNLMANVRSVNEIFEIVSLNNYALKAINHLIANNNGILGEIGVYLFGEFEGLENVKVKDAIITLTETDKHTRNGLLNKITSDLSNYRNKLIENGGDIPLTLVIDAMRAGRKESDIRLRVEYLEKMKGRPLTDEEIAEEGEFWEQSHRKTDKVLMAELDVIAAEAKERDKQK